jgi:hypothetical protein
MKAKRKAILMAANLIMMIVMVILAVMWIAGDGGWENMGRMLSVPKGGVGCMAETPECGRCGDGYAAEDWKVEGGYCWVRKHAKRVGY